MQKERLTQAALFALSIRQMTKLSLGANIMLLAAQADILQDGEHSDDIGCYRHNPFARCSERYQIGEDQD